MKILITTQVFPPERHPTAVMVEELASHLGTRGHDVTVVCGFPHHPRGRLIGNYRKQMLLRERSGSIDVIRGWHFTSESASIFVRAAVMASQALGTMAAALIAGNKPDLVINYGPPLIGPFFTSAVARRAGVPMVTVIYDIYPDVAIETGKVRNRLIIGVARWVERKTYNMSDRIVVLSDGFRRTLTEVKGVDFRKVDVVPVWLDPDEIRPSLRENCWRDQIGIGPNAFVVLYAGTIGIISGAEVMTDVADRLRAEPNLVLLFVGEGELKDTIESRARARGLRNIQFLPFQDRSRLNNVQATADVSVVTLAEGRGRTSVPSKVIGYMAAGRPVIASVDRDSDTAACVLAGPSGVVVSPGDATQIADAILLLMHDPGRRAVLGCSARTQFEAGYAAPAVLDRYVRLLEGVERRSA